MKKLKQNEEKNLQNYTSRFNHQEKKIAQLTAELKRRAHFIGEGVEVGLSFGNDKEYKSFLKGVFVNILKEIERNLLRERIDSIQRMTRHDLLLLCPGCTSEISTIMCLDCRIASCESCFIRNHEKSSHKKKRITGHTELAFTTKNAASITKTNRDKEANIKASTKSLEVEEEITLPKWEKFQAFCFPVYEESAFYSHFKRFYEQLYNIYVTDLGILEEKRSFDEKRFFDISRYEILAKVISEQDFNTEEKIYINRILYHCLITKGTKTTFEDVLKFAKVLQTSNLESKILCFFEILSDNLSSIKKKDLLEIIRITLPSGDLEDIEGILTGYSPDSDQLYKKEFFELIFQNRTMEYFFRQMLQIS